MPSYDAAGRAVRRKRFAISLDKTRRTELSQIRFGSPPQARDEEASAQKPRSGPSSTTLGESLPCVFPRHR